MKAFKSITLGLLSAAFLALGFNKVAVALDPLSQASHAANPQIHSFTAVPTCTLPCIPPDAKVS